MKLLSFAAKKSKGILPNLIIIGAKKSATTSLHFYLVFIPKISMSVEKELKFFVLERNWSKGVEWYKSQFSGQALVYGEASPHYTDYPRFRGVPERMCSVVPEAKLIYLLRDPIERIISDYVHEYCAGRERRSIEAAITPTDPDNHYVCRSKYWMQLERYLRYYPVRNISIVTQEELLRDRRQALMQIFEFLGVDDTFSSPQFSAIKNPSDMKIRNKRIAIVLKHLSETKLAHRFSVETRHRIAQILFNPLSHKIERPLLGENVRLRVAEHLRDDIERLRVFTGRDFGEWSV